MHSSMTIADSTQSDPVERGDLAFAYQVLAYLKKDDLTYAHVSIRPAGCDYFYIAPLGLLFSEITPHNLLKVTLDGNILSGPDAPYNKTGFVIHGTIYRHRPDVHSIIHLHTPPSVAISALKCGLLPISQFAFHFFNRLAYHDYASLCLDVTTHGDTLARDLGSHSAMLMRHHGLLTVGRTAAEAFFYAHYLDKACEVQCLAMAAGMDQLSLVPDHMAEQAAQDMRAFEPDLGARDWAALKRVIPFQIHPGMDR